jgi:hypothetical protein
VGVAVVVVIPAAAVGKYLARRSRSQ